ncbi:hypothetical protein DFA_00257 [Cavenderia fasciculata]|uniref:Uncharacterized protein n=1 Tax=Cavenderia fasciculata TaxID=261658 RepID=F4PY19_CACFS|nr:uncharacterized protein DFA_00257 [Cavenderia fasciculata]EGG19679.1 hypothetical protein DFA_00257 [Cavenderia fasciculata]|eukprot:XP_004357973.1 hypothetical protein DFA_00257 [Cavenderia fasciculata]
MEIVLEAVYKSIKPSITLAGEHIEPVFNFLLTNRYVVPSYLLCVFGKRLYSINKAMPTSLVKGVGVDQVEQFATLLEKNETMNTTLEVLHFICGNNYPMLKRLAHPRLIKAVIAASQTITVFRLATVTTNMYRADPDTKEQAIEHLFSVILTSNEESIMFIISALLPHLESVDDLPTQEFMEYCMIGGFPIQILVAEVLSKFLISQYNNRNLSMLYFNTPKLAGLFLRLIWCEQKNECSLIKMAAVIMFNHVGQEVIDNTNLLDDNEKMAVYGLLKEGCWTNQLSKSINKILVNKELFVQDLTANTLIWFGCGMACGWRQGLSIKYIVSMGLAYSAAEITRSIVKYSIDERRKSNINHLTTVLLAAIGVPHVYMYISMLKISPIPVLLLHLVLKSIKPSITLAGEHIEPVINFLLNNRYVVPSLLLGVFGKKLYNINKQWPDTLVPRNMGIETIIHEYSSALRDFFTIDQAGEILYDIARTNHAMCKVLADHRIVLGLINLSKLNNKKVITRKIRDKLPLDRVFMLSFEEATNNIYTISALLPHFESIDEIPIQELIDYCRAGGFPIEILVTEMLAKFLISEYDNHDLYGQKNEFHEFAVIRQAAIIMFGHVGQESIDNSVYLDDFEKSVANILLEVEPGQLSKFIDNILVNNEMLVQNITANGLIWFGCGLVCGWRQLGGGGGGPSIKYIVGMGIGYAAAEMTRQLVQYQIDKQQKSNTYYSTAVLLAAMSVPPVYMYISMLKVSPIPVLLLHLGRYLYNTNYINLKPTKKMMLHVQNQYLMEEYRQRIDGVISSFCQKLLH